MEVTHVAKLPILMLVLGAFAALFLWHSRPGRAVRSGMCNALRPLHCPRSRISFPAFMTLTVLGSIGAFLAVCGAYFFTARSSQVRGPMTAEMQLPWMIASQGPDGSIVAWGNSGETASQTWSKSESVTVEKEGAASDAEAESETWPASAKVSSLEVGPPPDWVSHPVVNRAGQPFQMKVTVGPYTTHEEIERNLGPELRRALTNYLRDEVSPQAGHLDVSTAFINDLIAERYDERLQFPSLSSQPMIQSHVLLEVDDDAHGKLDRKWKRELVSARLWHTGIWSGLVLSVLGTIYSYLRLDTLTRGYYTLRLRAAAAAAVSLAAATSVYLARTLSHF